MQMTPLRDRHGKVKVKREYFEYVSDTVWSYDVII